MGSTTVILRTEYFTEHTTFKLAVATGSTAFGTLTMKFCSSNPWLCALVDDNTLLFCLIGMMALDMVTGVIASRSEKNRITSRRLGEGIRRKLGMLTMIAGSLLLGTAFAEHGLEIGPLLYRWVTSWFVAVEFISLYENTDRMGVRLPAGLRSLVERFLEKADDTMESWTPNRRAGDAPSDGYDG